MPQDIKRFGYTPDTSSEAERFYEAGIADKIYDNPMITREEAHRRVINNIHCLALLEAKERTAPIEETFNA